LAGSEHGPILATGIGGTIGRHLATRAAKLPFSLDAGFSVAASVLRHARVIHLAAIVGEHMVVSDLETSRRVNVEGALRLAKQVRASTAKKFVFVSTSHVYATQAPGVLLNETSPRLPRSHYALQKLVAEELVSEEFRNDPERLIIARVFSIIGGPQPERTLGSVINLLHATPSICLRNADDIRDFLTPAITAQLLLRLALTDAAYGDVNVCSGIGTSIRDITKLVLGTEVFASIESRVISGTSNSPAIVGDAARLNSLLAVRPETIHRSVYSELQHRN
jgi:UDP-glucose 4-epimerase